MNKAINIVMLAGLVFNPAFAESQNGYNKNSSDAQAFDSFVSHIKNDLGYYGVRVIGFNNSKSMALTTIAISNKQNDFVRTAEISAGVKGADIFFRTYRNCTITNPNSLTRLVISVDNQNIQVAYGCAKAADDPSKTQEIFLTTTPEGKDYVQRAFQNKQYVFVRLMDGIEFPFATDGFAEAWNRINKPAL
jgi:hypothetical protein